MSQRALGFVLVAVAIVGAFIAFTLSDYTASAGFTWNLQNAYILRERVRCPHPSEVNAANFALWHPDCPAFLEGYQKLGSPYLVTRPGVRFGYVMAGTTAVGLAGVGLLVFGKSSK